MEVNESHRPYGLEHTVRIGRGDRCQIRKGRIPATCTLAGDGGVVTGVVLWIPRATHRPILEITLPPAGEVSIEGQAGMLVNDTTGPVVVRWCARL